MKKNFTFLLLLINAFVFGQPNSVELKDGTGNVLTRHATIAEAYTAIPATISNPYTIELTNTYTAANEVYPIVFNLRNGASPTNTITLRPAAGVVSVGIVSNKSGGNIITLDDADYIIIDGRAGGVGTTKVLTLNNTGTTANSNTIQMINGATNNIVTYCTILNGTTTGTGRAVSFGVSVTNPTGNSDNQVTYCTVSGGRYMINSVGTAANPNTRLRLYGCDLSNFYFAGFWVQAGTGKVYIDSCKFYHTISVTGETLVYGILFDSQSDSAIITKNRFSDISQAGTGAVKAIGVRSSLAVNYVYIYNNFINMSGSSTSLNMSGIELTSSSTTISINAGIYFNTIKTGGTLASGGTSGNVVTSGLLRTGGATSLAAIDIKNNIFVNERTGGTSGVQHVALALTNNAGTLNLDYNTYNSTSQDLVRYGANSYSTFASYQSAVGGGNENHSNDVAVQFVSPTDLHLAGSSVGNPNLNATPVNDITRDIDNQLRGSIPYRGGDEANTPLPVNLIQFIAAKNGNDVLLKWKTGLENNLHGYEVERSLNGVNFSNVGFVVATSNGAGEANYDFTDSDVLKRFKGGNLYYRLKLSDNDGRYKYSATVLIKTILSGDLSLSIYPNPFVANPTISVENNKAGNAEISIYNTNGQIVFNKNVYLLRGVNSINIEELNRLSKGNYFLSLEAEGNKIVQALIKL